MLKQLIYASRAVSPLSCEELLSLLEVARDRNSKHHITGCLVYKNSVFLQALEGEEDTLEPIWQSIQADSRHRDIVVMRHTSIQRRDFPGWSMGFANLSQADLSSLPGYSPFMEDDFSPAALLARPGQARDFLLALKHCELP